MTERNHLASLDAFRGLAVAGMILVNNPGNWNNVFEWLTHADWNGCTLADVVFPFFIFIMGTAMPFAFRRRLGHGQPRPELYSRIVRRSAALIALGLALNFFAMPDVTMLRAPGVLQRIGVVYLVTAPIVLNLSAGARAALVAALTLGHWALLTAVPFGGAAPGLLPSHNLAGAVDVAVFGRHILTATGDPEGLLGTIPAIATALLGSMAGDGLMDERSVRTRVGRLVGAGAAGASIGFAWSRILPLNKSLWTGSFVMWTGGLAALMLAGCYVVMDIFGNRKWAGPFTWLGFNPLAIYFLSELISLALDKPWLRIHGQILTLRSWLFWDVLRPMPFTMHDEWLSMIVALATVALWTLAAGALYRRGIRFQV